MKKTVIITLLSLSMFSCKKFLAERSQTDVIPETTKDFGQLLFTAGYPSVTLMQPYITLMDDDIQCYNGQPLSGQQSDVTSNAGAFQWQPDFIDVCKSAGSPDGQNFNSWKNYYQLILGTNVALQYLDNSKGSTTEKEIYKGEAYTLRAFYHFMLVNLYAKPYNDVSSTPDKSPGIPIRLSADLSEKMLSRNTVKEVYDQITKDLDSAMYFLDKTKPDQLSYRISHIAAHFLASRVYLYMEQWDKAIAQADYVLMYHPQLMNLNNWGGYGDPVEKPIIGPKNVETIWHYGTTLETSPTGTGTAYDVSHDLANCFEESDLRNIIFFSIIPDFAKPFNACDYGQMKFNIDLFQGKPALGCSWRSAEVYLNRAEAYIQKYRLKGDASAAQEALKSLNQLRANRIDKSSFTPWTIQPADSLLTMCRTERRRELFAEGGHRWFDLRRYGMPAIKHVFAGTMNTSSVYELPARDPQYVLPIPNEVLLRNPTIIQNPQRGGQRLPN
ncbi:SusD-like starch-binding protein associating with outer membrane [Chitinophaga niastensis]|uniref:SusD-like starch-binding protein associating with outer membrane n=1 Tax=Chitinophaga niastensis TaxID=536980 RepID=A0A2P8HK03_CHINA|nr:RagB/SusD family nutrient uptake outer membrane protein [Chitinophaga niastensis]PSL46544.1 SusD-like starch-binding protein associating with outer membrane [Chitinophaga niastensis]